MRGPRLRDGPHPGFSEGRVSPVRPRRGGGGKLGGRQAEAIKTATREAGVLV